MVPLLYQVIQPSVHIYSLNKKPSSGCGVPLGIAHQLGQKPVIDLVPLGPTGNLAISNSKGMAASVGAQEPEVSMEATPRLKAAVGIDIAPVSNDIEGFDITTEEIVQVREPVFHQLYVVLTVDEILDVLRVEDLPPLRPVQTGSSQRAVQGTNPAWATSPAASFLVSLEA